MTTSDQLASCSLIEMHSHTTDNLVPKGCVVISKSIISKADCVCDSKIQVPLAWLFLFLYQS